MTKRYSVIRDDKDSGEISYIIFLDGYREVCSFNEWATDLDMKKYAEIICDLLNENCERFE